MAKILDGKKLNEKIAKELSKKIASFDIKPKLVIIQVGNVAESNAYIGRKVKFGEEIGAVVVHQKFEENADQLNIVEYLDTVNSDPKVHGVIIQMPLPKHLNRDELIDHINPKKYVDGLTSVNIKKLWENKKDAIIPATTKGILTILEEYRIPISRQKVVIVGRSSLVGKPTLIAFLNNDATVTVCHKATRKLAAHTRDADILIIATGKPNLIGKEHVVEGQVVIDVGINALELPETSDQRPGRRLVGDVNFPEVAGIVAAITPVPGGVGPMTVASLFQNLLQSYQNQK